MSNELITQEQTISDKTGIEVDKIKHIISVLTPVQLGWLALCHKKSTRFEALEKFELSIQSKVNPMLKEKDLSKVQDTLKAAKKEYDEMKDCRLQFTNELEEKIIGKSMEFEKRSVKLIDDLAGHELSLRTETHKKADAEAALNREVTLFQTHVKNEYTRMATEYRSKLKSESSQVYIGALDSKMNPDGVPVLVDKLKQTLREIILPKFIKFERTLIDDDKAKEIFLNIPAYNPTPDLEKALLEVDETFSMYANDLANSDAAIEQINQETEEAIRNNNEALEIEQSTNNLISQAESTLIMTGGPKTKLHKTWVVVIEDNSKWELAVIDLFLKNYSLLRSGIKSASAKLTLGQMAAAIGKMVTTKPELKKNITNLKFEEKTK